MEEDVKKDKVSLKNGNDQSEIIKIAARRSRAHLRKVLERESVPGSAELHLNAGVPPGSLHAALNIIGSLLLFISNMILLL